ncbi:monofunctional biosynthetic peptidoglycan transglycosylase [Flavobacterium sp. xlx-214]|uniref:monofunctional biosynthetic peptidoglycan transglycosylase n=1 Tax=unclassified Flavobacterium TaxID=196869 RepID=UPI0013D2DE97|nr:MULTISPECIES: monofunctional biosynthetic peptidoglycan transglycosylase [unclassified Flavobacterium]MBA5791939.1 monofunctional biosynthetic peptidoglycan transglycosylase [Flavobacterium sp. xlx-221]QMI84194.1 monofunctional biosynthetic peptidoglycan transglycosylase [Flavobacterium sp. xlx-214]
MFSKVLKFIGKLILYFLGISVGLVIIFKFVPVPVTPLMVIRCVEQISTGEKVVWKHDWVSIDEMSINIQKAVIASEDGKFTSHNGFDVKAIEKAYQNNQKGKKIKGGSTISQQTAKNVFLWQGRSYLRKGLEAYFTVLIEVVWGKERIMEVYLNSIEMGNGIYGIEAASQHWFNKSANNLTKAEAAAIAAILPNPRKFKAANGSQYTNRRKNAIKRQMNFYEKPNYKK